MQIEISKAEVEVLEQALDVWEKEAGQGALMDGMFSMMLAPKENRDGEKDQFKDKMEKANQEGLRRKRVSTLLRAKLYQASALISEHEVSEIS